MKTYTLNGKMTTAHDAAKELNVWRQTVLKWLVKLEIPHQMIHQGDKIVATLFETKYMATLRARAKQFAKPNSLRTKAANKVLLKPKKKAG